METPPRGSAEELVYYSTDSNNSDSQSYNADIESPNDMLVDSEDFLNDADGEKDDGDVAIINPDEVNPRADDCMFLYISGVWLAQADN